MRVKSKENEGREFRHEVKSKENEGAHNQTTCSIQAKKATPPAVPEWSPTSVLHRRTPFSLVKSDGFTSILAAMGVATSAPTCNNTPSPKNPFNTVSINQLLYSLHWTVGARHEDGCKTFLSCTISGGAAGKLQLSFLLIIGAALVLPQTSTNLVVRRVVPSMADSGSFYLGKVILGGNTDPRLPEPHWFAPQNKHQVVCVEAWVKEMAGGAQAQPTHRYQKFCCVLEGHAP